MNERLSRVLRGDTDNVLLPFFWQHEGHTDEIPERLRRIYESGCRAVCVESRPFEDFAGPKWWQHMQVLLDEAEILGMQVWILDDKHFPTGYALGAAEKDASVRRLYLREYHIDVLGPVKNGAVILPPLDKNYDESIYRVVAFKRDRHDETLSGNPFVLDFKKNDKFLYFSLPNGCWRIFFIIKTQRCKAFYVDFLSDHGMDALVENVYESHYRHFAKYFGTTIQGFFSDEPSLDCDYYPASAPDKGSYYRGVGQPGVQLCWNDNVEAIFTPDDLDRLPLLWYPDENANESDLRYRFMDGVTKLWRNKFSYRLGNWCRAHGVKYIGHVVEDLNAHCCLGYSGGHFFRALEGQDMGGIDIVLHQVMPGMGDHISASIIAEWAMEPDFFHYVLVHQGSSLARITPHMRDQAMCEVFGAYGWAEGGVCMKWLMDFLMIRGTNHFVPHAFTDFYPDPDCPPHFWANGANPQYDAFSKIMRYTNAVCTLLEGAERITDGAVLYHGEQHWLDYNAMPSQIPAKALYDAGIDYDVLPIDALSTAKVTDGKLIVNGHTHRFLAIPSSSKYAPGLADILTDFVGRGLPVFIIGDVCEKLPGEAVSVTALADTVLKRGLAFDYDLGAHFLRVAKFVRGSDCIFYLFNESDSDISDNIILDVNGKYLLVDLLNNEVFRGETVDRRVDIDLVRGESKLLVFGLSKDEWARYPEIPVISDEEISDVKWEISILETGIDADFRPYRSDASLCNITGADALPEFSGKMRYRAKFNFARLPKFIDLGVVGENARLSVNGVDLGLRVTAPYRWDISDVVRNGENDVEIIASNTLANRLRDTFSQFMLLPPSGVQGPIKMINAK